MTSYWFGFIDGAGSLFAAFVVLWGLRSFRKCLKTNGDLKTQVECLVRHTDYLYEKVESLSKKRC